ncbi:MAG: hypothetical protein RCG15_05330 [Candidatus Rickettsia vulgarisii]
MLDRKEIEICTKVALIIILWPYFLLWKAITHGIPMIKNYYFNTTDHQPLQDPNEENVEVNGGSRD